MQIFTYLPPFVCFEPFDRVISIGIVASKWGVRHDWPRGTWAPSSIGIEQQDPTWAAKHQPTNPREVNNIQVQHPWRLQMEGLWPYRGCLQWTKTWDCLPGACWTARPQVWPLVWPQDRRLGCPDNHQWIRHNFKTAQWSDYTYKTKPLKGVTLLKFEKCFRKKKLQELNDDIKRYRKHFWKTFRVYLHNPYMAKILQPIKMWIKRCAFGRISLRLFDNEVWSKLPLSRQKAIRISHFVESIKFCHTFMYSSTLEK